jgi:hypothetical protein
MKAVKRTEGPNATMQVDRADVLEILAERGLSLDSGPLPEAQRSLPPPLPPEALLIEPPPPTPEELAAARRKNLVYAGLLVLVVACAVGGGLVFGLSWSKVPSGAAPATSQVPTSGSASGTGVITIPEVDLSH